MGGMNLLNKAGHEALDNFKTQDHPQQAGGRVNYRIYPEEPLNARIQNPEIRANCLIATIDRVPCTIALPEKLWMPTVKERCLSTPLPMLCWQRMTRCDR